ncbi:ABC transporter permease [Streptomyces cremeus]|uniref:ABC transporter permease n=1 Tax=Streptomyces cremeus TaxID=66881 RepID=A0ABV5P8Z4_STRCM
MSGAPGTSRVSGPDRLVLRQSRPVLRPAAVLFGLGLVTVLGLRLVGVGDGSPHRAAMRALTEHAGHAAVLGPLLIGALVAGPLVARELDSGTYRLAWTLGMSPARWLGAKIGVAAGAAAAGSVLLGVVFRLGQGAVEGGFFPWHQAHAYAASGTAGTAYALLGVAVGALTGLLVRRTLLAAGAAAVATGALTLAVGRVREYLWPVVTVTRPAAPGTPPAVLPSPWEVSSGPLTASGKRLPWRYCWEQPPETYADPNGCMASRGAVSHFSDLHPESHFWPLQLMETAVVLVLAAGAVWLAFRVLRRVHG